MLQILYHDRSGNIKTKECSLILPFRLKNLTFQTRTQIQTWVTTMIYSYIQATMMTINTGISFTLINSLSSFWQIVSMKESLNNCSKL